MKITEIQIIPIKANNGLVAFGSVVFDDCLYLGSIGIHKRLDGADYRITYPTKKISDKNINIYHPINKETSKLIEEAIISKVEELLNQ
ncbi:MAG: septation protein SpoVG family protein [Patescibacteria group bacterium]